MWKRGCAVYVHTVKSVQYVNPCAAMLVNMGQPAETSCPAKYGKKKSIKKSLDVRYCCDALVCSTRRADMRNGN